MSAVSKIYSEILQEVKVNNILIIMRKEMRSYLNSPASYIVLFVFFILNYYSGIAHKDSLSQLTYFLNGLTIILVITLILSIFLLLKNMKKARAINTICVSLFTIINIGYLNVLSSFEDYVRRQLYNIEDIWLSFDINIFPYLVIFLSILIIIINATVSFELIRKNKSKNL